MKNERKKPYRFETISKLHSILELPKPLHPLVSVIDFSKIKCFDDSQLESVTYNFYCIALKKGFEGKMKYGQNSYDFDEGVMTFFSPSQVISTEIIEDLKLSGWWLVVHPDFFNGYPLSGNIGKYGFFSYSVNEALHLSDEEENVVNDLMKNLQKEYSARIDKFSQDVMISQIDLLLKYCDRFYNRQFITRKSINNDLLSRVESMLKEYFESDKIQLVGQPTVKYLGDRLHISPHYLSDMLRQLTGQSAQQYIHNALIGEIKILLTTTNLSMNEIAYKLGFEYPQSMNKLFKNKTMLSPTAFRKSFNSN